MRRLILLALATVPLAARAQTVTPQEMYQIIGQERVNTLVAQTQVQIAQARQKAAEDALAAIKAPKMEPAPKPDATVSGP